MQPDAVIFVLRISVVNPPQDLQLLQAGLVHDLVVPGEDHNDGHDISHLDLEDDPQVPDDLDANFLTVSAGVPRPHHVREDALASVAEHLVPGEECCQNYGGMQFSLWRKIISNYERIANPARFDTKYSGRRDYYARPCLKKFSPGELQFIFFFFFFLQFLS